ncbi:hypothetical protein FIBSPDRAFT_903390 [Athelia psychrophila]|uniref:Uncharacterized protein n=1 Tax=Athelia psychrophila TaxID=1759441 RepID=A0A167W2H6_9AGAM|nr:hypothetical protein FIBSPDRAFT_903390 [Fibularhizoctonia sp. CBS 109695]
MSRLDYRDIPGTDDYCDSLSRRRPTKKTVATSSSFPTRLRGQNLSRGEKVQRTPSIMGRIKPNASQTFTVGNSTAMNEYGGSGITDGARAPVFPQRLLGSAVRKRKFCGLETVGQENDGIADAHACGKSTKATRRGCGASVERRAYNVRADRQITSGSINRILDATVSSQAHLQPTDLITFPHRLKPSPSTLTVSSRCSTTISTINLPSMPNEMIPTVFDDALHINESYENLKNDCAGLDQSCHA